MNSPVTSVLSGFDHAPLLAAGDRDHPVLPGSGLKGALRSQAERIARTLATQAATDATDFLETCPVCSPVMSRPKPDQPQPQESCDSLLEALGVLKSTDDAGDRHLCLACQLFGSPRRGSRLRVEDASLVGTPKYKPRDFLAVDRFTGGGADQFKFDAAVLWTPRFKVVLYLENPLQWELGWLVLALRDFQEGLGTVGFGAAKGFGRVEAEAWRTEFGCLDDGDAHALGLAGKGTRDPRSLYHLQIVDQGEAQAWKQIADGWVSRFVAQVEAFRTTSRRDASDRPQSLPGLPTDTWFGTGAKQLYGNEEAVHA